MRVLPHKKCRLVVHPPGFEPGTTVPKTGMISISLRVRTTTIPADVIFVKTNRRIILKHDEKGQRTSVWFTQRRSVIS